MSVVVVLVLIWAAVLVPPALRARADRRAEFIDSFRAQMGALGNGSAAAAPRPVAPAPAPVPAERPVRRVSAVQRRRDVLGGLLGAMIGALVLGAVPSLRMVWALFLFLLNLFIGYCSLLAHQRSKVAHVRPAVTAVSTQKERRVRVRVRREPALTPAIDTSS